MKGFFNKSLLGIISSLVFAIALFIVYRLGFEFAGAPVFGTWLIIQSILIVVRLPEAGIGINLTREIAIESLNNPNLRLRPYIIAGLLISVLPIIVVGFAAAYPALWIIEFFFDSPLSSNEILILILINVAYASLYAIGTMLTAIMEGTGKLIQKYYLLIISNASLAIFAFPLISNFGIFGVASNYLLTSIILSALSCLFFATRSLPLLDIEHQTTRQIVARLWKQNVTVSSMALLRMSFEPWSKFVIGLTGGLAVVAYADLAFKITNQVRNIIQSACQPLLTYGARSENDTSRKGHAGFELAQRVIIKVNILIVTLMIIATPVIAMVGIGKMIPQFALVCIVLSIANGVNSVGVIGYYYSVSAGNMGILLRVHGIMFLINLFGGALAILVNSVEIAILAYAGMLIFAGRALAQLWIVSGDQSWRGLLKDEAGTLGALTIFTLIAGLLYRKPMSGESLEQMVMAAIVTSLAVVTFFVLQNRSLGSVIISKLKA